MKQKIIQWKWQDKVFYPYYLFSCFFCLSWMNSLQAQPFFPVKAYPAGQFRNPLDIPMELVGNFGECRPNHFHSGIDIRTAGRENLKVYAIEEGYVSRIKIEPGGFGNAIFINHPNGYTSVYAHLNSFFPELEQWTRKRQYDEKQWAQDIPFPPQQFRVAKGQFIAYSGNTGSSQGPHLHLEIRNTKTENPLNPLLFFTQLNDTRPPILKKLAVYKGTKSIYEQDPDLYSLLKGHLKKDTLTVASSSAYIGIVGDDVMEKCLGTLGIYEMRMYVEDQPYFGWQMDDLSYDVTRYMNALADYKTRSKGGPWIQLCHQLPNNQLKVYKDFTGNKGKIIFNAGEVKKIRIEVYDVKYNRRSCTFYLRSLRKEENSIPANSFLTAKEQNYHSENIQFNYSGQTFYDHFTFKENLLVEASRTTFVVGQSDIPLHDKINLYLKPDYTIPSVWKSKMIVTLRKKETDTIYKGFAATVERNMVKVMTQEFGYYTIQLDTIAPIIQTSLKNGMNISSMKRLNFHIQDDKTTVSRCEAFVEDQWLRMVQKGNTWYYEPDEYFPSGNHTFTVKATDENNNVRTLSLNLNR